MKKSLLMWVVVLTVSSGSTWIGYWAGFQEGYLTGKKTQYQQTYSDLMLWIQAASMLARGRQNELRGVALNEISVKEAELQSLSKMVGRRAFGDGLFDDISAARQIREMVRTSNVHTLDSVKRFKEHALDNPQGAVSK